MTMGIYCTSYSHSTNTDPVSHTNVLHRLMAQFLPHLRQVRHAACTWQVLCLYYFSNFLSGITRALQHTNKMSVSVTRTCPKHLQWVWAKLQEIILSPMLNLKRQSSLNVCLQSQWCMYIWEMVNGLNFKSILSSPSRTQSTLQILQTIHTFTHTFTHLLL